MAGSRSRRRNGCRRGRLRGRRQGLAVGIDPLEEFFGNLAAPAQQNLAVVQRHGVGVVEEVPDAFTFLNFGRDDFSL